MVEISEDDVTSDLPLVQGRPSQSSMGPPPQRQPASAPGTRSIAGSSASPSSQPSSSAATPSSQPSSSNKKPRVGVKKSWVWNHFDIIEDGAKAKCKHCPKGR
ncbi:hypothetical protein MKX01_014644, partial [Papaver californicum]